MIKMIYYKLIKTIIDAVGLVEVIIDMLIKYHGLPELIISDQSSLFTSKFWSLLYYFFDIKQNLFTIFYLQINGQIKRQNSTIEAYLGVFVN